MNDMYISIKKKNHTSHRSGQVVFLCLRDLSDSPGEEAFFCTFIQEVVERQDSES